MLRMIGWDDLLDAYLETENVNCEVKVHKIAVKEASKEFEKTLSEDDSFLDDFFQFDSEPSGEAVIASVEESFSSKSAAIEACKICFDTAKSEENLCCFGCNGIWHRSCVLERKMNLCPAPITFRFAHPTPKKLLTHAPWYCNSCVSCSKCGKGQQKSVCCRKCGKSFCLSCLREGGLTSRSFQNLSNFACDSCLQCVNCGCSSTIDGKQVILYDDNRFCRPCYLSNQINAICPLCQQIYHWLPLRSDFGDVPFVDKFSLCPMIECDGCSEWVHCVCEGLSEEEYERLGRDKRRKFYCLKCRRETEDGESIEETQSTLAPGTFAFKFRNPLEAWTITRFTFSFENDRFKLACDGFCIEAEKFADLLTQFRAAFSTNDLISWSKALRLRKFFNPSRLMPLLPDPLATEVAKLLPATCARTQGFTPRSSRIRTKTAAPRTRLSLQSLHLAQSMNPRTTNTPSTTALSKIPPTLLYMQYLNAARQDDSIKTVDAFALGVALRPSRIAGLGLFAAKPFPTGSLIIEYCGEMLHSERLVNRRDAYYNALGARFRQSCYLFRLDDDRVLDATLKGNLSRFINHSCDPNCYSRVVSFEAKVKKLLIFALKDIEPGEEIVYDYKFPEDEGEKIVCYCGAAKCRGFLN